MNCEDGPLSPRLFSLGQYYLLRAENAAHVTQRGVKVVGDTFHANFPAPTRYARSFVISMCCVDEDEDGMSAHNFAEKLADLYFNLKWKRLQTFCAPKSRRRGGVEKELLIDFYSINFGRGNAPKSLFSFTFRALGTV